MRKFGAKPSVGAPKKRSASPSIGPNVSVSFRVSAMIDSLCPLPSLPRERGGKGGLASFAIGRRETPMAAPDAPPLAEEGRDGGVVLRMCPCIRRHVGDVAVAYPPLPAYPLPQSPPP